MYGPQQTWYATNEMYTPFGYRAASASTSSEPFPLVPVAASAASAAVIGVGLLVYLKKRKR